MDERRVNMHHPLQWPTDAGRVVTIIRNPFDLKQSFLAYALKLAVHAKEEGARCRVNFGGFLGTSGFHGDLAALQTIFKTLIHENSSLPAVGGGVGGANGSRVDNEDGKNHTAMALIKPLTTRLQGCQVKMVLGMECLSRTGKHLSLQEQQIAEAVDRVKQFAFVGIFERWKESIELFHARLKYPFPILPQEIVARRKTDPHKKQTFVALLLSDGPDRADRALYDAATVRFDEEIDLLRDGDGGGGGGGGGSIAVRSKLAAIAEGKPAPAEEAAPARLPLI